MILLWGLLEDDTFRSVHDCLNRRNADVAFVNHAAIGRTALRFRSHPQPSYELSCEGRTYALAGVSAAYLRPYDHRDYREPDDRGEARLTVSRADLVHQFMNAWAENSDALIVNRPSASATNHSKLDQAAAIRAGGFLVPESLVTNDRASIRDFRLRHGSIIYKSMSSVRSIVKELDAAALDSVGKLGPVFFQQRAIGHNVRVHVVGTETFACRIDSPLIDYRYGPAQVTPFDLPDDIAARCVRLSAQLGLILSGIDLIATAAGEFYCLEVNPNPAFSYFDRFGDEAIAQAVAGLLMR